jgi:hypothetical protein
MGMRQRRDEGLSWIDQRPGILRFWELSPRLGVTMQHFRDAKRLIPGFMHSKSQVSSNIATNLARSKLGRNKCNISPSLRHSCMLMNNEIIDSDITVRVRLFVASLPFNHYTKQRFEIHYN